ncbi:MAG: hypothetical protein NVS3B20_25390 [Polyangiales bacterium]
MSAVAVVAFSDEDDGAAIAAPGPEKAGDVATALEGAGSAWGIAAGEPVADSEGNGDSRDTFNTEWGSSDVLAEDEVDADQAGGGDESRNKETDED